MLNNKEYSITPRGFKILKFEDAYNIKCSIQQSSVIDHFWVGVSDIKPMTMDPIFGWRKCDLPQDIVFHSRMHLNKEQIGDLINELQKLVNDNSEETTTIHAEGI